MCLVSYNLPVRASFEEKFCDKFNVFFFFFVVIGEGT